MNLFIKKCLLFLAIMIASAYLLDYAISEGLKKTEKNNVKVWNDIFYPQDDIDVVVAGNSRAQVHINPLILDTILTINSYNLGINASVFEEQYIAFSKYINSYKQLKLIIQSIDYNLLQDDKFKHKRDVALHIKNFNKEEMKKIGFDNYDLQLPLIRYTGAIAGVGLMEFLRIKQYKNMGYKGYVPRNIPWDGTKMEKMIANGKIVGQKNPKMVNLFDKFLQECSQRKVKVVLVFTPQYYRSVEAIKGKEDVMKVYNDLAKKYDVFLLDYTRDSLCYDTNYFYNATHLNKKGSELFSVKLANDIKKLDIL